MNDEATRMCTVRRCNSAPPYYVVGSDNNKVHLEFGFTRILMKIFITRSKEIVTECQNYFSLHTVGELIKKRKLQYLQKIVSSSNTVCNLFMSVAVRESELLAANT